MSRGNESIKRRPIPPIGHQCAPPDATGLPRRTVWVCPGCGLYWATGVSWADRRRNRRRRKAERNATIERVDR